MKLILLLHTFCYNNKTHYNLIAGQEIVAGDDIYGGSDRLLSQVCPKSGLVVKRIDTGNLDEVRAAVGPSTKIVWIESPTNPRQMISDIRVIYTTSLIGILAFSNVVSLVRLELEFKEVSLGS
jgi:cystathionine beta-lyase/cystathionine gamma-synthase